MIGWRQHNSYLILDFGLKISTKYLLKESQRILFIPIWCDTKLSKLVLFDVKDTARLSSEQIILSRVTWCHLGELRYITSNLPYAKVDIDGNRERGTGLAQHFHSFVGLRFAPPNLYLKRSSRPSQAWSTKTAL